MEKIKIHRLMGANVYADGSSLLGRAGVVTLPDIEYTQAEHNAVGLIGVAQFFTGIGAMTTSVAWTAYYPEVLKKTANPFQAVSLQVRGDVARYTSQGLLAHIPIVFFFKGKPTNLPNGTINPRENVEITTNFACTSAKLTMDGEDIYEIDTLANIFKIGGVDQLAAYNRNLGLTM